MSIIEGIGDEVTSFAVVTLLAILVLSFSYLWRALVTQSTNLIHQSTSSPSEELDGAINSAVLEENQTGSNIRLDRNSHAAATNGTADRLSDVRTEELNSCGENGHETTVVEDTVVQETSRVTDPLNEGDLQQHSSSPAVMERTLTTESSSNASLNTNSADENTADVLSATVSETEQSHPDQIVLRLKYLNDMERTVNTRLSKIIADFKRDHFSEELAANKTVRLIFNGQLLRNEVTLEHYGVSDGCVVHAHISQSDPQHPSTSVESNMDLDLSHLLWPLLFVVLILLWILYFRYPQFFNVTSTGILLIFTGGFIFVYGENRLQIHN